MWRTDTLGDLDVALASGPAGLGAVLTCGLAVFVIVIPAVSGPIVAGRLSLVALMLLWAALSAWCWN